MNPESTSTPAAPRHFIRQIIDRDLADGKNDGQVITRFPPEPNGYLHIGHAKSICLNFGLAQEFGGRCHLRYDDTNPAAEEVEYVDAIEADVRWLGFDWGDHHYFASNYFERLYEYAEELIQQGDAYVCSLSADEFKEYRGVPTRPGQESPARNQSPAENLDLFRRMRAGEFADGAYVLRAKIDMASPNLHMRDPTLYRIKRLHHHRTGDTWCIYPMYDFAHCISDAIEGITHSICTLEFEVHRPLYDWILDRISIPCHPQQIEFARLNLTYTVMSKRRLLQLVREGYVQGWDDPRMPTLCGMRRRGYPPAAIRAFCETIGVTKYDSMTEMELLEYCVRQDLNAHAHRRIAVLDPLRVVITNFPDTEERFVQAINNPEDETAGTRSIPFTRELYIERADFAETPPPKFFRLAPGKSVRLRYAGFITCEEVEKDPATGEVIAIHCRWDPPDTQIKVKATIHWLAAAAALQAEVRMYDRLFTVADPMADKEKAFTDFLNPDSLRVCTALIEPALLEATAGEQFQFERTGYFGVDTRDSRPGHPVFNQIVALKASR